MEKPYRTGSELSKPHEMGGRWGDSNVSRTALLCRTSTKAIVSPLEDLQTNKIGTFVVLLTSSSGPNLSAFTATVRPPHSRFQRSVYRRVAKGISPCILKSSLIRQDLANLPNVPHNLRSTVNAVPLRSAAMSGCWRICMGLVSLKLPQLQGKTYCRLY